MVKTQRLQDSRREELNDYKIVEGKNLVTTLSNESHRFMIIFSNLINQGVASRSNINWGLVRTSKKNNHTKQWINEELK